MTRKNHRTRTKRSCVPSTKALRQRGSGRGIRPEAERDREKWSRRRSPRSSRRALASSPFAVIAESPGVLGENGVKNLFGQVIPVFPTNRSIEARTRKGVVEMPAPPLRLSGERPTVGPGRQYAEPSRARPPSGPSLARSSSSLSRSKRAAGNGASTGRRGVSSIPRSSSRSNWSCRTWIGAQSIVIETRLYRAMEEGKVPRCMNPWRRSLWGMAWRAGAFHAPLIHRQPGLRLHRIVARVRACAGAVAAWGVRGYGSLDEAARRSRRTGRDRHAA